MTMRNVPAPNVGIEIENESARVDRRQVVNVLNALATCPPRGEIMYPCMWELVDEGSLRAGPLGWELRTRNEGWGMPYERALTALYLLYPVLHSSTGTWRAAIHIHVNAADMNAHNRAIALAIAFACDHALFERHSPQRRESNFCEPLSHKTQWVMSVINDLANNRRWRPYGRYSSVNADALDKWNSLEFRHMQTPRIGDSIADVTNALNAIRSFMDDCCAIIMAAKGVRYSNTEKGALQKATLEAATWLNTKTRMSGCVDEDALARAIGAMQDAPPVDITTLDLGSIVEVTRR